MRILALMTDAFAGYGGIAQFNRDLLISFSRSPDVDDVRVLVRLAPEGMAACPAKVRQMPAIGNNIGYSLAALWSCLTFRPDVIFCGHLYHGPLADMLARITGAKIVCQLHGTEVWTKLSPHLLRPLDKADFVGCVSRDTKRRVDLQSTRSTPNTYVIANTVGEVFVPSDRRAAREKFEIGNEKVILTVARLDIREGYKGHDRIIAVLASLQKADRRVIYCIAGQGPDDVRLKALVQAHHVTDLVRFLGKVPFSDLPDLYRAADVFALPSMGEGFGIVFLEAMGCGTRSIGLAIGGSPDALGDGELGDCVSEAEFPAALTRALDEPRLDPDLLSKGVHSRFGRATFNIRVQHLISRLTSPKL